MIQNIILLLPITNNIRRFSRNFNPPPPPQKIICWKFSCCVGTKGKLLWRYAIQWKKLTLVIVYLEISTTFSIFARYISNSLSLCTSNRFYYNKKPERYSREKINISLRFSKINKIIKNTVGLNLFNHALWKTYIKSSYTKYTMFIKSKA